MPPFRFRHRKQRRQLAPVSFLGFRFMLQPLKETQLNIEIVKSLFPMMFAAQYGRQPGSWESTIGLAFIFGDLVIGQPPRDNLILAVYEIAVDVVNHITYNGQITRSLAQSAGQQD